MLEYILKFEERCQCVPYIAQNDWVMRTLCKKAAGRNQEGCENVQGHMYKEFVKKSLMAEKDKKEIKRERQ